MEQVKLADTEFWEDEATTAEGHARLRVKVGGMHCSLCVGIIERALRKQPGVHKVCAFLVGLAPTSWRPSRSTPSPR